jgi:hypothetical protein
MAKRGACLGWDPGSLIAPDVLLPEQRQFSNGERTGAEALLWAVLMDGIRTYCVATLKGDTRNLAYREAEHWMFGLESDALTSFDNLCRVFDIDPHRLRAKLRDFTREPGREVTALLDREAA